jgi:hypothetical protein
MPINKAVFSILAAAAIAAVAPAHATTTVFDPVNDFIGSYTGPHQADLDVVSLSVDYDPVAAAFHLSSTMAGMIDPSLPGFYAIGVNTGTGINNFAAIGVPGVVFNKVIAVQKAGTAAISGVALPTGSVTISGKKLSVIVPLSMLPSTGFRPTQYGFNIWPRSGTTGGNAVISDFAPDNATASVPEPSAWLLMIAGLGAAGFALRRHRAKQALAHARIGPRTAFRRLAP